MQCIMDNQTVFICPKGSEVKLLRSSALWYLTVSVFFKKFHNNPELLNYMSSLKVLNYQILTRKKLKPSIFRTPQQNSYEEFSSIASTIFNYSHTETLTPNTSTDSPSIPTLQSLLKSVQSSQWHFIKQLAPNLSPSLISSTSFSLQKKPDSSIQFITHIGFKSLDTETKCLAIAVISRSPVPKPALQLIIRFNQN